MDSWYFQCCLLNWSWPLSWSKKSMNFKTDIILYPMLTKFIISVIWTIFLCFCRTPNGDVHSHLNISQVRTKHGGIYQCTASSKVGSVEHTRNLNVFGAPFVRKMEAMKVVAGKSMYVTCPVAGYPVSRITWEKDGRQLPFNDRYTVWKIWLLR